jgi:DNA-binding NtrC family response regulator
LNRTHILLIEDEAAIRFGVAQYLGAHEFSVQEAGDCAAGLAAFSGRTPDAVIMDYQLPDGNGLELLPKLRALDPGVPLIFLTGHGSIDLAVRAIQAGAEQFLTKPVELPALLEVLRRALENQRNRKQRLAGRSRQAREQADPFIGSSALIRKLAEEARRLAAVDSPVLIQGPTGSGKSLLARWLHDNGPRAEEAFVDLNCAGLAREFLETELFGHEKGAFTGAIAAKPGMLEVAHRGTVFLDEIGDMDIAVQPKMLKVLEEKRFRRIGEVRDRTVDIRLIAATHQDLDQLIAAGRFREDLLYRINTLPLTVPSLRERPEDIPPLAVMLLERIGRDLGRKNLRLLPAGKAALQGYGWPGNIRELRNVLERAALLSESGEIGDETLRFSARPAAAVRAAGQAAAEPDDGMTMEAMEKRHIERALQAAGGSVEQAAHALGIPRSTLYQRIKKFALDKAE